MIIGSSVPGTSAGVVPMDRRDVDRRVRPGGDLQGARRGVPREVRGSMANYQVRRRESRLSPQLQNKVPHDYYPAPPPTVKYADGRRARAWLVLLPPGILVPGGFGDRGVEGKISAAKYARESKTPYLGICLGMQIAVIEFCRSKLGMHDAQESGQPLVAGGERGRRVAVGVGRWGS
eukprot:1183830-Prorocentrum_minimum.AAC.5